MIRIVSFRDSVGLVSQDTSENLRFVDRYGVVYTIRKVDTVPVMKQDSYYYLITGAPHRESYVNEDDRKAIQELRNLPVHI